MVKKFHLREDHFKLLDRLSYTYSYYHDETDVSVLPDFNHKRLFGNTTSWQEVAELLGLEPVKQYTHRELMDGKDEAEGFPCGYSPAQRLECLLRIVELPMAMSVIFKNRTMEPGLYEVGEAVYFRYVCARNYVWLLPVIQHIEEMSNLDNIPQLRELAANIYSNVADPYRSLLDVLCDLSCGLQPQPDWLIIAKRELARCSNAGWSAPTGRVPTLEEAPIT